MNTTDRYAKIREALEMRPTPLPRDLVMILRTEAQNQRTPPIDYVIAEDGGRMVHRPEPDIAMAELLEEAADKLEKLAAENERLRNERDALTEAALAEKDKEIAALREALEMIARIDLSHLSECRDIARAALKGASDERS